MSTITAGLVAADYFMKYPGRFNSMHLQDVDMKAPAPSSKSGRGGRRRGERHPQVALGQGSIDWVKTFTAAKTGGVKNYFVEQSWELTQAERRLSQDPGRLIAAVFLTASSRNQPSPGPARPAPVRRRWAHHSSPSYLKETRIFARYASIDPSLPMWASS